MADAPAPALNLESIALSASLFTAAIDAWVPASFGKRKTDAERTQELNDALLSASIDAANDRLGLGHPGLNKSKVANGPSLSTLQQRIQGNAKGKRMAEENEHTGVSVGDRGDDDDVEEEDSRIKAVGKSKRKIDPFDPLRNKKAKKAALHPSQPQSAVTTEFRPPKVLVRKEASESTTYVGSPASEVPAPMISSGTHPTPASTVPLAVSPRSPSATSRIPDALLHSSRNALSKNQKSKARKKRAKIAKYASSTEI